MIKISEKRNLFIMTWCFSAIIFLAPSLSAQVKIPEIPAGWPQYIQNSMNVSRDALIKRLKNYDQKVIDFNRRCTGLTSADNTALISSCQKESATLDIESDAIDKERDGFLSTFHDNEKFFAPNTNTSVVDARNVSSGLLKATDDAIIGAYKNAPPGVSDRVRKALQAVATNDWKVAKAWFQDALLLDPNNKGLQKFIVLCDYTPDSPQQVSTLPSSSTNTTANDKPVMPTNEDLDKMFDELYKSTAARNANNPTKIEINQCFLRWNEIGEGKPLTTEEVKNLRSPQNEKMRRYIKSLSNDEFRKLVNANLTIKQMNDLMIEDMILHIIEMQPAKANISK